MMTEGEMFEDDAAIIVGTKLIEMADRLRPVDRAVPGSVARYAFEMDGVTYEVAMTVRHD